MCHVLVLTVLSTQYRYSYVRVPVRYPRISYILWPGQQEMLDGMHARLHVHGRIFCGFFYWENFLISSIVAMYAITMYEYRTHMA